MRSVPCNCPDFCGDYVFDLSQHNFHCCVFVDGSRPLKYCAKIATELGSFQTAIIAPSVSLIECDKTPTQECSQLISRILFIFPYIPSRCRKFSAQSSSASQPAAGSRPALLLLDHQLDYFLNVIMENNLYCPQKNPNHSPRELALL